MIGVGPPAGLPFEAVALIAFAKDRSLLIGNAAFSIRELCLNPHLLYTADEWCACLEDELQSWLPEEPYNRWREWRLVDPQDLLRELEQNYDEAKSLLEAFRKRFDQTSILAK
jgi:hypothetical protein